MFCPKCGTQLDNNARFCSGCGYMFENLPSAEPVENSPVQPAQPAPQQFVQQDIPASAVPQPQVRAKKTNSVLVFFVTFLVLGAITAAVMLFVYPGRLKGADDDDSSSKRTRDSSSVSQADSDSSKEDDRSDFEEETAATTTTATTTIIETIEPPEEVTTTATADILTPPDTQATTSAPTAGGNTDDDLTEAMNFSTTKTPTFDEFEWCYGQAALIESSPASAEKLDSSSSIAGGWKAMFCYYTDSGELLARELNNIYFDVAQSSVTATVTWHYMEIVDSEPQAEDDLDPEAFDAVFADGGLKGKFYGSDIEIYEFWKENGKEYAVGRYDMPENGVRVYIALVR